MKLHRLALAISAALVIAPTSVYAECVTDTQGDVECTSNGFNDAFQVNEDETINGFSLKTKGYTSLENKGAIDTATFTGEGISLDIVNHGYIRNVDAYVSGDINFHNFSKMGDDEVNSSGVARIGLNTAHGNVSLINDGDFKGDYISLNASGSTYFENSGVIHGWILDSRSGSDGNSSPTYLKNTGELTLGNFYVEDRAGGVSLVNTGQFSSEYSSSITSNRNNSAISISNSGVFDSSLEIYAYGDDTSVSLVNTGTITDNYSGGGIQVAGNSGPVDIYNSGTINSYSDINDSYAIGASADNFNLYLANDWQINGHVSVTDATGENAAHIKKLGLTGDEDTFLDISRIRAADNGEDLSATPDSFMGFNTLEKTGKSLWTLVGEQASGGFTHATVDNGALLLSDATLRMAPVTGTDDDNNTAARHALINNAGIFVAGASAINGSLVNNGTLTLNDGVSATPARPGFNSLTVTGDYTGQQGSKLVFNTRLGNDKSPTDKLTIQGNTAGESQVIVNNLGGKGAKTVEGIKLIAVEGQSDGVFRKADGTRIVAGAYDYDLVKSDGQSWYLSSALPAARARAMMLASTESAAADEAISTEANGSSTPDLAIAGKSTAAAAASSEQVWRPESGSYAANLLAANTLFNTTLHDRAGESQYTDALTGEQRVTSMWLRNTGGHQRSKMGDGQNKTQANSYVMQLGGDIAQWSTDGSDRYHLGVMAGYANQKSRTHSSVSDYRSRGQINGYSTGLYGTWYANNADKSGLYVDSWLQYSWFNNSVKGDGIASESYKSRGLTGSLETGYTFKVGETTSREGVSNSFWVQPQAQATWMGVKAKKHTETNGTRVEGKGQNNVQTRLGVKAYMQGHSALDDKLDRTFQPYVTASWIHNTKKMGVTMDGESNTITGTKDAGEVKVGVEGQLNRNLNLWGGVAQQVGSKGYSDSQVSIGVKYQF